MLACLTCGEKETIKWVSVCLSALVVIAFLLACFVNSTRLYVGTVSHLLFKFSIDTHFEHTVNDDYCLRIMEYKYEGRLKVCGPIHMGMINFSDIVSLVSTNSH